MVFTLKMVLAVLAAAGSTMIVAAADFPSPVTSLSEMPPDTAGAACPDSCGCLPKLCTDDAVIKGTTTHVTYLCPETKTVQMTKTIFVTVEKSPSNTPVALTSASTSNEETTTVKATSKSTVFVTKTVISKLPTTSSASKSSVAVNTSFRSSSGTATMNKPAYTESVAPTQDRPAPTTTVQVTSDSTIMFTRPVSQPSRFSVSPPQSVQWSPNHTEFLVPTTGSSALILTNPLRASETASGIWLNTSASDVFTVVSSSSDTSVLWSSSGVHHLSTLYLTIPIHNTSATTSSSKQGGAVSLTANSTINSAMSPATSSTTISRSISTSLPATRASTEYTVASTTESFPVLITATISDDRPSGKHTAPISDDFIPLSSGTETSYSIGEDPTSTEVKLSSTTQSDKTTPTDMEVFPTIKSDDAVSSMSVSTEGIFFSSEAPAYPVATHTKRDNGDSKSSVAGTISKVYTTTTITLLSGNKTVISIQTEDATTVGQGYNSTSGTKFSPGVTTEPLSKGGTGNTRPNPSLVVIILLAIPMTSFL